METHFLPIQYELRDLVREGDYESAHRALNKWAEAHASDPALSTHALRFRAILLQHQYGPIPEVGELYRDVWRASKSLGPGDQAAAINDILFYAHSVGDVELGNQGRAEYAQLLQRYGEDPVVRDIKAHLCLGLGWLSHVQGDLTSARSWFANAAIACEGDGHEERQLKTMAWSLVALECTRLEFRMEASMHLAKAKETLLPGTYSAGYYYWAYAENSLALGRVFDAVDAIEEASRVRAMPELKILVPCTRGRIEASLGHTAERDKCIAQAEAEVTPHTALYLRQEIEAVRPKPT